MEPRQGDDTPLLIRPVPPTAERLDKKKFLGVFAVLGLVFVLVFAFKLQHASTIAQTVQPAPLPSLGEVNATGTFDQILQVPRNYAGLDRRPPAPKAPTPGENTPAPFGAATPGPPPTPPPTPRPPQGAVSVPKAAAPPVAHAPAPKRWLFADLSSAVGQPPFPATGTRPRPPAPPAPEDRAQALHQQLQQLLAGTGTGAAPPPAPEARREELPPTDSPASPNATAAAPSALLRPARLETPADPGRVLYRSQAIPALLLHEMVSDIPGQVRLMVSQAVLDRFHQGRVLIPQHSILIGRQEATPAFGQNRLAVTIEEVHTPDGAVLALPGQVADRSGASGVRGKVNNHYGQIGVAAVVSAALNVGARSLAGDPSGFQLNMAQELAREAGQSVNRTAQSIVERTLNIPPRITLKAGTAVTIELQENLVLPRAVQRQ